MVQTTHRKITSSKAVTQAENNTGRWYSEDELNNEIIQAYKNFEKSLKQEIKITFLAKLGIAKEVSEKIYHSLNAQKNIKCKRVYLRPNSLISYEAIIVIPEKAYLSDAFSKAYEIAFEVAKGYQKTDFNFDFNFMPSTRHINATALLADGFNLSFQPIKVDE
jgi:hypothetical protein